MFILKTEDLAVGYDKKTILGNVTFSVERGEIVSLIGPNGAGKSTLLKTIMKSLEMTAGCIFLGEEEIRSLSQENIARRMSVVLTDRVRAEWTTCEEAVAQGRYPYTGRLGILSDNDRKCVLEAMELAGISDLRDRYLENLSDGQRQRVMLARAICQEPEVLVLDEPTTYLDIKYKLELLKILRRLSAEKNTAVFMTMHELDLAKQISHRIICVKDGRVDRIGAPNEIFRDNYIEELFDIEDDAFVPEYFNEKDNKTEAVN